MNPKRPLWKSRGPGFLLKWLAVELCSLTNSRRSYLNLSDGRHFENLGVYQLLRRRCRLIIVSDADADPDFEFEDLGGLIRKCRTDFGIDIEIDTGQLRPASDGLTKWHCAVGTIRYDHTDLRWVLGRGGPFKLVVFFPKTAVRPADDKFAGIAQMWLTFFSFYDFRRPGRDWPCVINDEVLVWDSDQY